MPKYRGYFFNHLKQTEIKVHEGGKLGYLSLEKFVCVCLCQIDKDGLKQLDFSKVLYANDYLLTFLVYRFFYCTNFNFYPADIPFADKETFSTRKYIELFNRLKNELIEEIEMNLITLDEKQKRKYFDFIANRIKYIEKNRVDLSKSIYQNNILNGLYDYCIDVVVEERNNYNNYTHSFFKEMQKQNPLNVKANIIEIENLSKEINKAINDIKDLIQIKEVPTKDNDSVINKDILNDVKEYLSEFEKEFQDENDFNLFIDLLASHFSDNSIEIPTKLIKIKKHTKLLSEIGELWRKYFESENRKLSNDTILINLIKILNKCSDLNDSGIKKYLYK